MEQRRQLDILQDYRIDFKDTFIKGKINYKLNHYKSIIATIHTMYVNEKIIRIFSFCPFSP